MQPPLVRLGDSSIFLVRALKVTASARVLMRRCFFANVSGEHTGAPLCRIRYVCSLYWGLVAGRRPFCRYATNPLSEQFVNGLPTFSAREKAFLISDVCAPPRGSVAGRQPFCRFATFPLSGESPSTILLRKIASGTAQDDSGRQSTAANAKHTVGFGLDQTTG